MLNKKIRYLQIALNSTLEEAQKIISQIPLNERILIEAGTPLIKAYGEKAIKSIKTWWELRTLGKEMPHLVKFDWDQFLKIPREQSSNLPNFTPYIVADTKCMDRGVTEVEIASKGGASAATVLGIAPIETIEVFIEKCQELELDSMIDMMNVDFPLRVLRELKKPPEVVILHRGVDEEHFNKEKEIPFHEIHRIKSDYDIMIAVAGGDTIKEVQQAIFNDVDIVVVWKSFYQGTEETAKLAEEFLKEIK